MEAHGIAEVWKTRGVVVAITGAPGGEQLVRRAARIAGRLHGGLVGVHVVASDGLQARAGPALTQQRRLLEQLGGNYRESWRTACPRPSSSSPRSEKATQIVVGATRRNRWHELLHGSVVGKIVSNAAGFDVHVIAQAEQVEEAARSRPGPRPVRRGPSLRRRVVAWILVVVGLPALTAILAAGREHLTLATDLLLFLVATVGIALLGGVLVGVVAAVVASLLANWYFVEPIHTFTVSDPENVIAIAIFVAAAVGASVLVDRVRREAARRSRRGQRPRCWLARAAS